MTLVNVLPIILIVVVFYFLLVRPQRRRQQEMAATQGALQVGAEVMLGSGIFGRVSSLEDQTIHLELSPGNVVKVARQAVVRVVTEEAAEEAPAGEMPPLPPEEHTETVEHPVLDERADQHDNPDDPPHPGR